MKLDEMKIIEKELGAATLLMQWVLSLSQREWESLPIPVREWLKGELCKRFPMLEPGK